MMTKIRQLVEQKVREIFGNDVPLKFDIEPTDQKFGDYSTNIALSLSRFIAKATKGHVDDGTIWASPAASGLGFKNPVEVAEKIAGQLRASNIFEKVEVAPPGFINFKLSAEYLQNQIAEILKAGESYGDSDLGKDLKVNIEFISANPTGPLTLGNGRGGYGGDCLARVLKSFGAEVNREYYVNDAGGQAIALGHSVLKDEEAVYKGDYIEEIAPKITSKDPKEAGSQATAIILEEYIKKTIQKMGIEFNDWYLESNLRKGPIEEVLGLLEKNPSLAYKNEGALWLKTTDFGDDKDRVVIKKDGEFTYITPDIAYHWTKMRRGYNTIIDILGADHHGYVGRLKAGVEIIGRVEQWGGQFKVLLTQLIRLISNGKEVKMSKRAGTYVTLDELIDEVGSDVTRFFFLQRSLDTHMDFDLDLAKEHSEKNPVYYVQYAHARISSILVKHGHSGGHGQPELALISEPEELALVKELIKLPDFVVQTAEDYQVQRLTYYSIKLADAFHRFYEKCKVISDDPALTESRIALILATKIVLKKTFDLMGISAPEKM